MGTFLTGADLSTIVVVPPVINLMLFPCTHTPPLTLSARFLTVFYAQKGMEIILISGHWHSNDQARSSCDHGLCSPSPQTSPLAWVEQSQVPRVTVPSTASTCSLTPALPARGLALLSHPCSGPRAAPCTRVHAQQVSRTDSLWDSVSAGAPSKMLWVLEADSKGQCPSVPALCGSHSPELLGLRHPSAPLLGRISTLFWDMLPSPWWWHEHLTCSCSAIPCHPDAVQERINVFVFSRSQGENGRSLLVSVPLSHILARETAPEIIFSSFRLGLQLEIYFIVFYSYNYC